VRAVREKGATKQARSHSGACDRSPSSTKGCARKRLCCARKGLFTEDNEGHQEGLFPIDPRLRFLCFLL
jgi:hypothetical protein